MTIDNTENYLTAVADEIARDCVGGNKTVKMRSAEFAALANEISSSAGGAIFITIHQASSFLSKHAGKTWSPGFEQVFISKETDRELKRNGSGTQTFTEYVFTPIED